MESFKAAVDLLYSPDGFPDSDKICRSQLIMFPNARTALEKHVNAIRGHLDDTAYDSDVVVITSPMFREQKFYYMDLFLNPELVDDDGRQEAWPDGVKFDCCGCLTTRSLGSSG
jgi:hypothetical protein